MPQKPPNKTKTRPGLGEGGSAFPRMDSAEMKRVRDNFRGRDESGDTRPKEDSIPESSRALRGRLRDSVRREDPDDPPPKASPPPPASAPRGSIREETSDSVRPRLRDSVRREDPDDDGITPTPPRSDQPAARRTSSWESEPTTGTRRKSGSPAVRSGRPPVTVDDVGTAAVKLARGAAVRESAPKLIASRSTVAKAPIDTRAAFVLSLVDGRNTVDSLVDMAGMPEEEVRGILARLARLGLISLP